MPPTKEDNDKKLVNSHKCTYCAYSTHRRSFMNDHVRVHTGEKPFSCDTCAKAFSQKSNLRQHLKVHNQGNNSFHVCNLCDFKTKWKSSLQVHERMHNGEKPYKCKICDRAFSQSTHCQTHMREAHLNMRKFQCDICSKTFKRHEHLERHQAFHKEERDFECDICHKKYLDARYLKQHKLIHDGEASKIHKCPLCPYKSRYKQGLRIHTRIHTGLRPYKCGDCSKTFVTSQSMTLHTRMVHQGILGKIYHCDQCSYCTACKQNLKAHLMKVHNKDQANFKCRFCTGNNVENMTRAALTAHMIKAHPREIQEEHKQRLQRKSPCRLIGRLSVSPAKSSPREQSPRRLSKSPKPAGGGTIQANIKTEPGLEVDQSNQCSDSQMDITDGGMAGSMVVNHGSVSGSGINGIEQQQGAVAKQRENNQGQVSEEKKTSKSGSQLLSPSRHSISKPYNTHNNFVKQEAVGQEMGDNEDVDVELAQKSKNNNNKMQNTHKFPSNGHSRSPQKSRKNDFLRIKLNSPKSSAKQNAVSKSNCKIRTKKQESNGTPKLSPTSPTSCNKQESNGTGKLSPTSPTNCTKQESNDTVKLSPKSPNSRNRQKSPVPSAKRARALFVKPEVYIDRDSELESLGSHSSKSAIIGSIKQATTSSKVALLPETPLKKCDKLGKNILHEMRQYDSLRAIISEFVTTSSKCPDPHPVSPIVANERVIHETIQADNGEVIEIHMVKEEPQDSMIDIVDVIN